jgi:hypothetical protein
MPWLIVNQTLLCWLSAVPTPVFALDVQRGAIPGQPGVWWMEGSFIYGLSSSRAPRAVMVVQFVILSQPSAAKNLGEPREASESSEATTGLGSLPSQTAALPDLCRILTTARKPFVSMSASKWSNGFPFRATRKRVSES